MKTCLDITTRHIHESVLFIFKVNYFKLIYVLAEPFMFDQISWFCNCGLKTENMKFNGWLDKMIVDL